MPEKIRVLRDKAKSDKRLEERKKWKEKNQNHKGLEAGLYGALPLLEAA
jgi:hypothetical protein